MLIVFITWGGLQLKIKKEIHTNKAKLTFFSNGTVEKKLFNTEAKKEINSLIRLNNIFVDREREGWLYKAVKIIRHDVKENKFIMKEAKGVNFSEIFAEKPKYSHHMGVWLALYHNDARVRRDKVILYTDFIRGNFIIDEKNKVATAIDPGSIFGKIDCPEKDIIITIYSLMIGAFRSMLSPFKVSNWFIRSYNKTSNEKINKENMESSWRTIRKSSRFRNRYKSRPIYLRPLAYCAMVISNLYMTILIKRLINSHN